jgi:hypothetical protein
MEKRLQKSQILAVRARKMKLAPEEATSIEKPVFYSVPRGCHVYLPIAIKIGLLREAAMGSTESNRESINSFQSLAWWE